ncbi:hypothetical protein AND_009586 [Anopheles darlingi]|uniref:Leucine-rich repeat protein n=1 Tax=Anopheles darlingi TaxID=43151 RepID=W5J388_ANODA|nr:hypothetical protein AND_009586 [Anopheles darlingi]
MAVHERNGRSWCCAFFMVCLISVCSAKHSRQCLGGSEIFVCTLLQFDYEAGQDVPHFNISSSVTAVKFIIPPNEQLHHIVSSLKYIREYDSVLHRQLGSPKAIEIQETRMHTVEMSAELLYADFTHNSIKSIIVNPQLSYALQYLDLNDNYNVPLENVSHFVQLKTLHLTNCHIESIPERLFAAMVQLQHLTLAHNRLTTVDLKRFPPSLTLLFLNGNDLKNMTLGGVLFPSLEHLNVRSNRISSFNATLILPLAPKLKLFSIGHNPMMRSTVDHIVGELNRRNISHYSMENPDEWVCKDDETIYEGVCFPKTILESDETSSSTLSKVCIVVFVLAGSAGIGYVFWIRYKRGQ